uniref:Uncharacterized protein n=1 Tax=Ixodes ricinus TaxID=34613 RepID=A0A6B0UBJ5_IXORI
MVCAASREHRPIRVVLQFCLLSQPELAGAPSHCVGHLSGSRCACVVCGVAAWIARNSFFLFLNEISWFFCFFHRGLAPPACASVVGCSGMR